MTWLWMMKKRRERTIFLFLTFILTTPHMTTAEDETTPTTTNTTTTGEGGGEGGGGGGGAGENATEYSSYLDLTNFVDGLNDWDFMGVWAKYDLSLLSEDVRPLPLVPDQDDQGVFICQTSSLPSTLQKSFPTMHNASFSLTYYAKASGGELFMTGKVVAVEGASETFFNYSVPGEGAAHPEGSWGTDTFEIPLLAAQGSFKIVLGVQHSEAGVWAAAEIQVEGVTGPPITTTTTPAPPIIPPQNNLTTESNLNETETTTAKVNGTAVAPPNTTTTSTTTTSTTTDSDDEELSRLESVAQAVWDAFYVFLALFCACLVALVALIVHGRCKDDEPPPAVATYNPRTASYRMDKVYDNPSYDNNAV